MDRQYYENLWTAVAGLPRKRRGNIPALSRLMKDGIGAGMTREDHRDLASQLFSCYAYLRSVRELAAIIGEEELSRRDKVYLEFGEVFETKYLAQGEYKERSVEETLDLGWSLLSLLPREELIRIPEELIGKHLPDRGPGD